MAKSPEGYIPSDHEMKSAEETMTDRQSRMSETREDVVMVLPSYEKNKKDLGVSGDVWKFGEVIKGELNGHSIELHRNGIGIIDGSQIGAEPDREGNELIKQLFDKYVDLAELGSEVRHVQQGQVEESHLANQEIAAHEAVEVAKDLLGN